ncbi:MAG: universal stress protein [Candidatus Obscuribacterales bacterium]|nr:universal stress protein [Candidatus Obscuribacterales bacterium]
MKILIAIDDSPCSLFAFDSVLQRTWPAGSEFKVLSMVEPLISHYDFAAVYPIESMLEAEHQRLKHAREMVAEKVSKLKLIADSDGVSGDVLEGSVPEGIVQKAGEWGADLIVVGSHGRRGLKKFMLGSVAEKVVVNAHCSVEIVRDNHKHATLIDEKMSASTMS